MKSHLLAQFAVIQEIRNFFCSRKFIDVLTPPMVSNPGMETHIHPFQIAKAKDKTVTDKYLHTSPEFHMKELLSEGFEKIFTMSYCFRDEPDSPIHRSQFIMLEWYRANASYNEIMDDCENLIKHCTANLRKYGVSVRKELDNIEFTKMTIQELFLKTLNVDILNYLTTSKIKELIKTNFKDVPIPDSDHNMSWDDYYFLLFLNKVEPELERYPYILLYEFPYHLSALSTLKEEDPRVCERFEIYMNGVELCNCFNELTNIEIQKKRFEEQAKEKKKLYNYSLPEPRVLYRALEKEIPSSAGIALGVERLLKSIIDSESIFWNKEPHDK